MPASASQGAAFQRILDRVPGAYGAYAAVVAAWTRPGLEWRASGLNQLWLSQPEPDGLGVRPRDLRPADLEAGRRILAGAVTLGGETLTMGPKGDPWDRPSPSRRFAAALHGFGWIRHLTAHGEPGAWEALIVSLAAGAAFVGHLFPVWLGFKGGKGVATFFGTLLAAAWPVGLAAGATWILMAAVFRFSSVAALVAVAVAPIVALLLHRPWPIVVLAAVMALLVYIRHDANIRRLLKGEEPKIGGSKTEQPADLGHNGGPKLEPQADFYGDDKNGSSKA